MFNGYGEMTSDIVIDEWGLVGSPILLIDTTHIGLGYDAVVRYMAERDPEIQDVDVVIPVVAETDDGFLNDNRAFGLTREDVWAALDAASDGPVAEGVVGAATGTQQFDFKGGIGTASRVVELQGTQYTIGVLLQTNYGSRHQLQIAGAPIGRLVDDLMPVRHHEGSCIAVVATDAPLHPRQLRRLARRVDVGLARTGSVGNDGSGEIFLAFSTANRIPRATPRASHPIEVIVEGQFDAGLSLRPAVRSGRGRDRGGGAQRPVPGRHRNGPRRPHPLRAADRAGAAAPPGVVNRPSADVVIVGGGIIGTSAAAFLAEGGLDVGARRVYGGRSRCVGSQLRGGAGSV